ncbi:hypothetical protein N7540_000620 [Penicillium herquei]|nr:hypothetical protein N7540_000620 [Penicillium herquei]
MIDRFRVTKYVKPGTQQLERTFNLRALPLSDTAFEKITELDKQRYIRSDLSYGRTEGSVASNSRGTLSRSLVMLNKATIWGSEVLGKKSDKRSPGISEPRTSHAVGTGFASF